MFCRAALPSNRGWFPQGMYVNDEATSYRLGPDFAATISTAHFEFSVRTNSLGLRGPRVDGSRELTVGVFGDSFVFGQGVEEDETFTGLLSRSSELSSYEFINAGIYGFIPAQAYALYQRLDEEIAFDIVVIQVGNNDVAMQDQAISRRVYRGKLHPDPPSDTWSAIKEELRRHSEFVAQLRFAITAAEHRAEGPREFLMASYERDLAAEIRSTSALLQTWIDSAQARDQRVILVYLPDAEQIDSELRPQQAATEPPVDVDVARIWSAALARENPDIGYVDVTEAFRHTHKTAGAILYIPNDGHTTATGNQVVADLIREAIREATVKLDAADRRPLAP
jgi:lysophospholipase L1-like esterase